MSHVSIKTGEGWTEIKAAACCQRLMVTLLGKQDGKKYF